MCATIPWVQPMSIFDEARESVDLQLAAISTVADLNCRHGGPDAILVSDEAG